MSTIPEIQAGLRRAANELTARILELTRQLSEIQAQQQEAAGGTQDFARLSKEGGRRPIQNHPIAVLRQADQISYLAALCALAQAASEAAEAWLLLQRVASGLRLPSLEQPLAAALRMGEDEMDALEALLAREDLTSNFLLDAMLVRLCCGENCPRTTALLEKLVLLVHPPEQEARFLARLADILIRQDGEGFLKLWKEQGLKTCPGICYLQKTSGVLVTDDPQAARAHGFRRVILHDCTLKPDKSDELVLDQCILLNCKIECALTPQQYLGVFLQRRFCKIRFLSSALQDCVLEFQKPADSVYSYGLDDFCTFEDTPRKGLKYKEIKRKG